MEPSPCHRRQESPSTSQASLIGVTRRAAFPFVCSEGGLAPMLLCRRPDARPFPTPLEKGSPENRGISPAHLRGPRNCAVAARIPSANAICDTVRRMHGIAEFVRGSADLPASLTGKRDSFIPGIARNRSARGRRNLPGGGGPLARAAARPT